MSLRRHVFAVSFVVLCAACAHGGPPAMTTIASPRGLASAEEAVAAYLRAGDERQSRLVRAAFHPSTPIQWVEPDGSPRALAQIEWWPRLDGATGAPARERTQRTLDRSGGLALVEAVSRWDDRGFDDLLVVARTADGWRIVGKVFVRLGPGPAAAPEGTPEDERAIRAVLATKIEAHAAYDPELLRASHLPDCRYYALDVARPGLEVESLSEGGARYAARRDAGETDRESPWRVLLVVVRGSVAAAKLDVVYRGRRYVDELLLLRTAAGWRIAAAAWGPA